MPLVENAKSELGDLVRENITQYEAKAETLGKNFKRTLLGVGAYFLVKYAGPDSGVILGTMTWVAEKAAFIYTATRAYQTLRDFFNYI
ncbi:hypothetical protein KY360_03650 [Candidatus Woesearchaeota archaeon]|nr:hypothetical protein [Candidatus Woesearchaeota archaeon]